MVHFTEEIMMLLGASLAVMWFVSIMIMLVQYAFFGPVHTLPVA